MEKSIIEQANKLTAVFGTCPIESRPPSPRSSFPASPSVLESGSKPKQDSLTFWNERYPFVISPQQGYISFSWLLCLRPKFSPSKWCRADMLSTLPARCHWLFTQTQPETTKTRLNIKIQAEGSVSAYIFTPQFKEAQR